MTKGYQLNQSLPLIKSVFDNILLELGGDWGGNGATWKFVGVTLKD